MGKTILFADEMDSPIGTLLLMATEDSLIRVEFGSISNIKPEINEWVEKFIGDSILQHNVARFDPIKEELQDYFNGDLKLFTTPVTLYGTEFQKAVWTSLFIQAPFGKTKTYEDIAKDIKNPQAVRAVGGAVGKNPLSIIIPCHRIVGKNGKMVGYNGGLDKKEYLLKHEGVLGTLS